MPVNSAARIVNRDTIPSDQQQLQAFLTGCGVPPERHTPWLAAFAKISSQATGLLGAAGDAPWTDIQRRVTLRQQRQWVTDLAAHWPATRPTMQDDSALHSLLPGEQAHLLADYAIAEAGRNGLTADQVRSWRPDYLLQHDGKYLVLELKSASSPKHGRGPHVGGAMPPRRPSDGTGPTAARKKRRKTAPENWSTLCLLCQNHASAGHSAA